MSNFQVNGSERLLIEGSKRGLPPCRSASRERVLRAPIICLNSCCIRFRFYALPVKSTVVLEVEFPELSAGGATRTAEPEIMFSQLFTNASSVAATKTFNMKTTLLDTHTFVFEVRSCLQESHATCQTLHQRCIEAVKVVV